MEMRFNKPRVFLSHSSLDVDFVVKLQEDFRACQIDCWRDQTDIRDGQPFLDAIFEDGIPTCDAILAYFSPNSLQSKMFAKEVDSAILSRLKDNNIVFLPYVSNPEVRKNLRIDLQALQCRAWNQENYDKIFPSVVAEVWRSFLERSIENATSRERVRRLELELEIKNLTQSSEINIFSDRENTEFEHIFKELDIEIPVRVPVYEKLGGT